MKILKYRLSFLNHQENKDSPRESDSFTDLQHQGMVYMQEYHKANINGLSATFLYIYPNFYDDNEFVHVGCQNSFDDFLPFIEYREKVPLLVVQLTEKDVKQKSVYQSSKMQPKKKTVQIPEVNYTQKLQEPNEYFQGLLEDLKQFEIGMLKLDDRKDWKNWKNQHQKYGSDFALLLQKRSQRIFTELEEILQAKNKADNQIQSPPLNKQKPKLSKKEAEKLLDDQFLTEIKLKQSLKKQLKKEKKKNNEQKLPKETSKSKDVFEENLFDSNISSDEIVDEKPPIPKVTVPQQALEDFNLGVLELSDQD